MSIEVKSVTKFFGTQKALDDVTFDIHSGEVVGFLGPNHDEDHYRVSSPILRRSNGE